MLLSFDIDFGWLLPNHQFIARGLADDGLIEILSDESYPGFSFEYELVRGVEGEEGREGIGPLLVGVNYGADVPLPSTPADSGAIAAFVGGPTTRGTRDTWPLPREARILKFPLFGLDDHSRWPREGSVPRSGGF